jgi:hypothetical protein
MKLQTILCCSVAFSPVITAQAPQNEINKMVGEIKANS